MHLGFCLLSKTATALHFLIKSPCYKYTGEFIYTKTKQHKQQSLSQKAASTVQ